MTSSLFHRGPYTYASADCRPHDHKPHKSEFVEQFVDDMTGVETYRCGYCGDEIPPVPMGGFKGPPLPPKSFIARIW